MLWVSICFVVVLFFACCCAVTCVYFFDNFSSNTIANYTVRSGSWSIASGTLRTTSANALILASEPAPSSLTESYWQVRMHTTAEGDKIRFVFLYVDDNNYWFVELEVLDPNVLVGGTVHFASLALWERVGGTNTQHEQTLQTGIDITTAGTNTPPVLIAVCYQDGDIYAELYPRLGPSGSGPGPEPVHSLRYTTAQTLAGTLAGVATSTLTGTASFDDLNLATNTPAAGTSGGGVCDSCFIQQCGNSVRYRCEDGKYPTQMSVVLSGFNATASMFNGTFVLTKASLTEVDGIGDPAPAQCQWLYTALLAPGLRMTITAFVDFDGFVAGTDVFVDCTVNTGPAGFIHVAFKKLLNSTNELIDCRTFNMESLAQYIDGPFVSYQDGTPAILTSL